MTLQCNAEELPLSDGTTVSRGGKVESRSLFGRTLRTLRKAHKKSQTEVATRAVTDQKYISELETGFKTGPTEQMIFRLAIAIHAELWEVDLLRIARGLEPLDPDWRGLDAADVEKLLEDLEKGFPGDLDYLFR